MNGKCTFGLLLGLLALAAITLLMAQSVTLAQGDPSAAVQEKAKEKAPTTKPAECDTCNMCMMQMQRMAKLKDLLTEAKGAAEAENAKKTLKAVEEAIKAMDECHKSMHEAMKHHMHKMHRGMMGRAEGGMMHGMKCPMCGKMMGEEPKVVNSVCPIMGNKIDPQNVPDDLTREFHGKKVGFCCADCPPAWDKLSDKDKEKKLEEAMASSPKPPRPAEHKERSGD